jgi:hypothetical protein
VLAFRSLEVHHLPSPPLPSNLSYTAGPPLPAETPKPPWRPTTAASICFFFTPVGGALVSAISLRRMGYQEKAWKVLWCTGLAFVPIAVIVSFTPPLLSRVLALGIEAAGCMIFPVIQGREFGAWEATHTGTMPSSGWKAIGWGLIGLLLFLVIVFPVVMVLAMIFPGRA